MNGLLTRRFWADTFERAIRAACWAVVGGQGASATPGIDLSVPLRGQVLAAGYAFLACVLFSVAVGGRMGAPDSASTLPATVDPPQ